MTGARRVVITGCGVQSPVGLGVPAFWTALLAGSAAPRVIARFPAGDLAPNVAAEVPWSDADPDRAGALADRAADEALADAGLAGGTLPRERSGVALGTTLGGMTLFEGLYATTSRKS